MLGKLSLPAGLHPHPRVQALKTNLSTVVQALIWLLPPPAPQFLSSHLIFKDLFIGSSGGRGVLHATEARWQSQDNLQKVPVGSED